MKRSRVFVAATVLVVLAVLLALVSTKGFPGNGSMENLASGLSLSPPPGAAQSATFLDQEAGMAGYAQVQWDAATNTNTWNNIKAQLQIIEKEGADYVVGTFALTDYAVRWDPHLYISKDGWVVVYWPRDESPAIFLDMKAGLEQTLPDRVIGTIAAAGGTARPTVSYYDFTHPTANRIVMPSLQTVAGGSAEFSITVPSGVAMLGGGWAFWNGGATSCHNHYRNLLLGGNQIACGDGAGDAVRDVLVPILGSLSATSFPIGTETTFRATGPGTFTTVVMILREN